VGGELDESFLHPVQPLEVGIGALKLADLGFQALDDLLGIGRPGFGQDLRIDLILLAGQVFGDLGRERVDVHRLGDVAGQPGGDGLFPLAGVGEGGQGNDRRVPEAGQRPQAGGHLPAG